MNVIAQDFLEQLKAANFNTGKAQNTSGNTNFDLSKIVPSGSNDLAGNSKLLDSTAMIRHTGDKTIAL